MTNGNSVQLQNLQSNRRLITKDPVAEWRPQVFEKCSNGVKAGRKEGWCLTESYVIGTQM